MATKSLELSIAERIYQLVRSNPAHHDAFKNHLEIIRRARIDQDHAGLREAVEHGAKEFGDMFPHDVADTLAHIDREATRSLRLAA